MNRNCGEKYQRERNLVDRNRGNERSPRNNKKDEENDYQPRHQNDYKRFEGGNNNEYRGPRKMDFNMLRDLVVKDDSEEVVFILSNDKKGFKELLDDKISPDMSVIIVKLLIKISNSSFHQSKRILLSSVVASGFAQSIISFVATLAIQDRKDRTLNEYFWNDPDNFWRNLINICKTLNNLLPFSSCEFTLKLLKAVNLNIPHIEECHRIHISDIIKAEVNALYAVIKKTSEEVERKKVAISEGLIEDDEDEPSDDFRDISVYPTVGEITNRQSPFLIRNIVYGPYQDVNHYLDIQYRVLREYFVLPLRNGICSYIEDNKGKLEDIKIYNNVKFLNMETVSEQNCFSIQYDFNKKKKSFQCENSRGFMFGSLLCFTADKFKTVFFAKVAQRGIQLLENGQLIVGFSEDIELPENLYDLQFLMVESKVYFEPYYQVLNVLKRMSTKFFPMENYIIKLNTDSRPPNYLQKSNIVELTIAGQTFNPLAWGNRKFYGLNDAQSQAFQAALTREFAIIQGPPGTGKTFLGLKIATTLLENKDVWYESAPMLVICFTDHALDQFLEGLIPTTKKLIRIGGQSKNKKVNEFNICNREYRQHTNTAIIKKRNEIQNYIQEIASLNGNLNEIDTEMHDIEDSQIMKNALVIGMTTTGAARLQSSLQALKSPIVIVEEAAEVLEAHIVAALTPHCKHLILIGDHQQLKPSTANFKIETKYLLGVSLFERMVANNIQCHTLNIQHRMRPEIANLIRPTIYPVLNDHASVFDRPHIKGVDHDLFFIDHNEKEQLCVDNSKKNNHEARFLIWFARHLVLNEYKPENIIILAAYLGQMSEMQREKELHRHLLQGVRIAVLDNYQGEESDIVLLSLVRSNDEKKIGFLKIENRVCLALSRARNGFYIMGNMKQLCSSSEIWRKIRDTLKGQDAIGPYLTLRCQIHRHQITNVSTADDFSRFPEGGCELLCEADLNCGHKCQRLCHVEDREHVHYQCKIKCEKLLCDDLGHVCDKLCYQVCGPCCYPVKLDLNCKHSVNMECHLDPATYLCPILVKTTLPCGHLTQKPCSADPETFRCPHPCDTRVEPCGHACMRNCHISNDPDHLKYFCRKPCSRKCKGCTAEEPHICQKLCFEECAACVVSVLKKQTKCEHMYKIACSADPNETICGKPCKQILACRHPCKKKCGEKCGDCQMQVTKVVPYCGHMVKINCCEPPTKDFCDEKCPRVLPCGHKCGKKCKETCRIRCKEIVDCSITSPCGHTITKISCYYKNNHTDEILLQTCLTKCNSKLQCKHKCVGTCGECFQGRFHQRCQEKCGVPLVCNHECPIPCREACKPCRKPCEYRCSHSKCKRLCGDLCTPCQEKCPRSCKHQTCRRKCGETCDVEPCIDPCRSQLKCGHRCVGFCGDPCPKLCRICNEEELTEIFFGTEDDENARFVLLEDCGHVLESTGMLAWLQQEDNRKEIKPVVCPKCKTVIKKSVRYSDYVKESLSDLTKVKIRFYGDPKKLRVTKNNLKKDLSEIIDSVRGNVNLIQLVMNLLTKLEDTKGNRRQHVDKIDIDSIRMKKELIEMIIAPFQKEKLDLSTLSLCNKHISFIVSFFEKNFSISQQEANDILLEIDRLNRWFQFERINYKNFLYMSNVKSKVTEITNLLESPTRYSNDKDVIIKEKLEDLKKNTASAIVLTDSERREIVKAMDLQQGHWYKCPNGHPYAITECGGAMQISKCYECGVPVGGTSHQLLPDNSVATEMDGARYGAWTEQANLLNYRL